MDLSFQTVDKLCSDVDLSVRVPLVDLSGVTFFYPFALVYLGMFLRHHASVGKGFQVVPPRASDARTYLARQNFWERFNFSASSILGERLYRFTTGTSLNDIVDIETKPYIAEEIADAVAKVLSQNISSQRTARIAELASELVDNFAQHSERILAAFTMQWYPRKHRIVMAIGDCGIGIRSSLASNPKYVYLRSSPHYEAALKAFEPLVSRKAEGGTGLTEVRDGVLELDGRLTLATGDSYVNINRQGTQVGRMAYDLSGVQVELSFPEGP